MIRYYCDYCNTEVNIHGQPGVTEMDLLATEGHQAFKFHIAAPANLFSTDCFFKLLQDAINQHLGLRPVDLPVQPPQTQSEPVMTQ